MSPHDDQSADLLRQPIPSCPQLRLRLHDGSWHLPGCGHETASPDELGTGAPLEVLMGVQTGLCPWAGVPPLYTRAGELLRDILGPAALVPSSSRQPNADDAAGWSRAVMTRRRELDAQRARLRIWLEDSSIGDGERCCAGCDRLVQILAELLTDVHSRACSRLDESLRSEQSRNILSAVTADHRMVCMALDQYQPHSDRSLDADISDTVVAAFTAAQRGTRVALRLPFGLAGFVAIHRNPGGYSEVDRDATPPDDVLETALVLWEPDEGGAYRRWPAALEASRRLR